MTRAEEIARKVVEDNPLRANLLRRKFAAALESYAAEERERCAKIAETIPAHLLPANATWDETALTIAARIREAGEPKS